MTDLFAKKKTKREELLEFIRFKKYVRTSDVLRWGAEHFFNRAERTARDLATQGLITRISEQEMNLYYPNSREEVWRIAA